MDDKAILHIDGDDFFAELIRRDNPFLRNRPVILGYSGVRGAVLASSYEARQSGIIPGMTVQQATRLCPEAHIEPVDWKKINKASLYLHKTLLKFSPAVESTGVDAFFMDYSGSQRLFGPAPDFATSLQRRVCDEMSMSFSVGLSGDKAVSAVACRAAKLGALENIKAGEEKQFLSQCPLSWLPGINSKLNTFFNQLGVSTIGELAAVPVELLEHILGKNGCVLSRRSRGEEGASVRPRDLKQISEEGLDFGVDRLIPREVLAEIAGIASGIGESLRRDRQVAGAVNLTLEYIDNRRVSGLQRLEPCTNLDHEILDSARKVFFRIYKRRVRLRRIELSARWKKAYLPELPFGDAAYRVKWIQALKAVDQVRGKYSSKAIGLGTTLTGDHSSVSEKSGL